MAEQSETAKGRERRKTILDAAREAFLANGFHATSMQDLFKATSSSPGAFYRYFPAKDALVRALANEAITRLAETVGAAIAADPASVADALTPALLAIDEMETEKGGARLAVLIWAEAQRSAALARDIHEAARPMLAAIDRLAAALLARGVIETADGARPERPRPDSGFPGDLPGGNVATVLAGLLQGYVVQRAMFGTPPDVYRAGLRTLGC